MVVVPALLEEGAVVKVRVTPVETAVAFELLAVVNVKAGSFLCSSWWTTAVVDVVAAGTTGTTGAEVLEATD